MARRTTNRRFTPGAPPARVVFLLVEPVQPLDLFGPLSVFDGANRSFGDRPPYQLDVCAWGDRTVRLNTGPTLLAARRAPARLGPLDSLVVVSGIGADEIRDATLSRYIARASARARRTVSICTGAFLLARAGLLAGRTATTHWAYAERFAAEFPTTRVEPDRLWVKDGPIYTSAGVTTGIDLALALVSDDLGASVALNVARMLVVFVQRPGGQAQYSQALHGQQTEHGPIRALQAWLVDHLRLHHTVDSLSARVGMSPRNFVRVFGREVGVSPAKYVTQLRVEAAQRRLERSDDTLSQVAELVGFGSADVLTRAFTRHLRTTPASYRARFAAG